jgi:hypothetical protein
VSRQLEALRIALVDGSAVTGKALEDLLGGLVPNEGLGVLVPGGRPGLDVSGELFDAAVS